MSAKILNIRHEQTTQGKTVAWEMHYQHSYSMSSAQL